MTPDPITPTPVTPAPTTTSGNGITSYHPCDGNICEVLATGQKITLTNYENATNPTYDQLLTFVKADKTDEKAYTSSYVCSGFAQDLHNNAEKAGIKCALVGCEFTRGEGHAFNEIQTTDKGIVYIDCTGVPVPSGNQDKVLSVTVGEPLTGTYLLKSGLPDIPTPLSKIR